ncbi:chorismate mutase [Mycobacterium sp. OTB74]|uniref:chorismate mutase n=1 Tax=Mycobacterium sp. OTB74 TaxID=1853452 RepID=UPI002475D04D|nr:chorismate mutase [Mycobacterium sp. OTB74]
MVKLVALWTVLLMTLSTAAPSAARADIPNPLYPLIDTAAQRLQTADPVAAFKWVNGESIEDRARSDKVLNAVAADARTQRLDPAFVRQVFADQIRATEGVEHARFAQWKLDPATAPTSAPDLSASRSAIDGFNRQMVAQLAADQDILHAPDCPAVLDDARAAVAASRAFDDLMRQALTVATHSYCS